MSAAVMQTLKEQTGKAVYEALGMSEVSTFVSSSPTVPPLPVVAGRVQDGRRVAVLGSDGPVSSGKPGVLAVARDDPGLMLGYLDQPEETAAKFRGEWFLTGDTVSMDAEGYVTYLGRDDDMMNAGGYRVSPLEVEAAMLGCAGVAQAAAVEVEVRDGVRVIAGFYVADEDLNEPLAEICARALAKYKRPRMFVRLDALPSGANNKIQRKALRDWTPPDQD